MFFSRRCKRNKKALKKNGFFIICGDYCFFSSLHISSFSFLLLFFLFFFTHRGTTCVFFCTLFFYLYSFTRFLFRASLAPSRLVFVCLFLVFFSVFEIAKKGDVWTKEKRRKWDLIRAAPSLFLNRPYLFFPFLFFLFSSIHLFFLCDCFVSSCVFMQG